MQEAALPVGTSIALTLGRFASWRFRLRDGEGWGGATGPFCERMPCIAEGARARLTGATKTTSWRSRQALLAVGRGHSTVSTSASPARTTPPAHGFA